MSIPRSKRKWYESDDVYEKLKEVFKKANEKLLSKDRELFTRDAHEVAICARLMFHTQQILDKENNQIKNFYADIEFNRNNEDLKAVPDRDYIRCDLIVHSRGELKNTQDNLIAIEMKKGDNDSDKARLQYLTMSEENRKMNEDFQRKVEELEHNRSIPSPYILGIYYNIKTSSPENSTIIFYRNGEEEVI